jgi:hypothetical protein
MVSNPATLAGVVRSDAMYRTSAATHQVDGFGPPKADFSCPLDVVMLHLWSGRQRREACLDQDDLWLVQPKIINLIAFKVLEQLYGFHRTHVALASKREKSVKGVNN